jgi:hypothetical protein
MTKEQVLREFFTTALKGESKTYNDHNWYVCSGTIKNCLRSYIEGSGKYPYGLLKKPLSQYTIGEIMAFQANPRSSSSGQLWATGRYQIIPSTLKGLYAKAGLKTSDPYSPENQDRLAWQLLIERKAVRDYISGAVPDTTENLQKASLEIAKIWSSIGIPYNIGDKQKNQSYYASKGDKASVSSEVVQAKLRELRSNVAELLKRGIALVKKNPLLTISLTVVVTLSAYIIINQIIRKN